MFKQDLYYFFSLYHNTNVPPFKTLAQLPKRHCYLNIVYTHIKNIWYQKFIRLFAISIWQLVQEWFVPSLISNYCGYNFIDIDFNRKHTVVHSQAVWREASFICHHRQLQAQRSLIKGTFVLWSGPSCSTIKYIRLH